MRSDIPSFDAFKGSTAGDVASDGDDEDEYICLPIANIEITAADSPCAERSVRAHHSDLSATSVTIPSDTLVSLRQDMVSKKLLLAFAMAALPKALAYDRAGRDWRYLDDFIDSSVKQKNATEAKRLRAEGTLWNVVPGAAKNFPTEWETGSDENVCGNLNQLCCLPVQVPVRLMRVLTLLQALPSTSQR